MPPKTNKQPSATTTTNTGNKRKRPASAQTQVKAPSSKVSKNTPQSLPLPPLPPLPPTSSSSKATVTTATKPTFKSKGGIGKTIQSYTRTTNTNTNINTPPPPKNLSLPRGQTPTPCSNLTAATPTPANTTNNTTANTTANTTTTSTTSTVTAANATGGANLYDAMLGEVSDLIRAAAEAQACGRLKMASTYQLLVHARLIGLGKRFDRFLVQDAVKGGGGAGEGGAGPSPLNHNTGIGTMAPSSQAGRALTFPPPQDVNHNTTSTSLVSTIDGTIATTNNNKEQNPNTNPSSPSGHIATAQTALAKLLPCEVDLDNTMMEHLARAAMELHHQRTRRGKALPRALSMTMTPPNNQTPTSNSSTVTVASLSSVVAGGGSKSQSQTRVVPPAGATATTPAANTTRTTGTTSSNKKQSSRSIPNSSKTTTTPSTTEGGGGISVTSTPDTKKRGGRTKKPPSRAMLTSGAASFDAKTILKGSLFRSNS